MRNLAGSVLWALACVVLVSCASRVVRPDPLAQRFAAPDARRARERAFDLYARAERAHQAAEKQASDSAGQADQRELARLLLLSAIAEADRLDSEQASAAAEARNAAALQERAQFAIRTVEAEQALRRDEAAKLAALELTRAFREWQLSGKKSGKRTAESERQAARAGEVLGERAALTLAAAIALGLAVETGAQVEQLIASAEHQSNATARLTAAHAALIAAERALGEARKAHASSPSPAEVKALLAMAAERGLAAHADARGVSVDLVAAFSDGSTRLTAEAATSLTMFAALLRAHPYGVIAVQVLAEPTASPSAQRVGLGRAQRIVAALKDAAEPTRLSVVPSRSGRATDCTLTFLAYTSAQTTP